MIGVRQGTSGKATPIGTVRQESPDFREHHASSRADS
jgi:hypothetical protein